MTPSRLVALAWVATAFVFQVPPATGQTAGTPSPAPSFIERPATRATLEALQAGGFVLYLRHGHTDNTRSDRIPAVDLGDCTTQRPLSDEGRQSATTVGLALRAAMIPIGDIHVSPLCRVRDSAAVAFPGRELFVDPLLIYTANMTDAHKAPILSRTAALLSAPVAPGNNRVVVAHAPNIMDLIGYFPVESTLVVFRPRGDAGFDYVASILWRQWPNLLTGR